MAGWVFWAALHWGKLDDLGDPHCGRGVPSLCARLAEEMRACPVLRHRMLGRAVGDCVLAQLSALTRTSLAGGDAA